MLLSSSKGDPATRHIGPACKHHVASPSAPPLHHHGHIFRAKDPVMREWATKSDCNRTKYCSLYKLFM